MSTRDKSPTDPSVLDEDILQILAQAQDPVAITGEQSARMRERVLAAIAEDSQRDFLTIRRDEGTWVEIAPKVEVKQLHIDRQAGTRSFLMRLHPGGEWPAHPHTQAEECMVLEGEVSIGDLSVRAGDYHLAPGDITHGTLRSASGALLFLRAGLADTSPTLRMKLSYLMRKATGLLRPRS